MVPTTPETVASATPAPVPLPYTVTENGFRCDICGNTWSRKLGIMYHLVCPRFTLIVVKVKLTVA